MKFFQTLTFKLGTIIAGILVVMLAITSAATYYTAYDKLYEAAGVEAYGCANITTGLIDPTVLDRALNNDMAAKESISEQLNWTIDHKEIFETQYILDLNGNVIALDNNLKEKGINIGDEFHVDQKAISMLLEMGHPTFSEPYDYAGMERLSGYAPIYKDHDPSKEIIAINVIDFDADIVTERTWEVVSQGILISIIPMLVASMITGLLIYRKTKLISQLIEQAKRLADGNLSVSETTIKGKDEIADLSRTLNQTASNLQSIISTMRSTSNQLTTNATETASTLTEMNSAIQSVADHIEDVTGAMRDGMHNADNASNVLTSLADNLQSMKARADQTVVNSNKTMKIAIEGEKRAQEISADMEKIRTGSQEVSNTIQHLVESATRIQTITEAISSIASQTNLLALNASIEAARAGEHGKGFAVVAEEVRKLAEQSNKEVTEVEKLVKDIMERIGNVMISSSENGKFIEKGTQTVQLTANALHNISNAVSETVHDIKNISNLLSSETEKSDTIVEMIHELTQSIHEIEDTLKGISAAAQETTASIHDISHRSVESTKMAEELEISVKMFRLKE